MKKLFTLLLSFVLLMAVLPARAQSTYEITGKVQEKGKTESLPGATVILARPNATTGQGVITDDQGAFTINNIKRPR